MSLCELCNGLSITKLYPPNIYYHANNMAALEASAKDCRICKMIYWCIQQGKEFSRDGGKPKLDFDGASDKEPSYGVTESYDIYEARNNCSVKLQIILGHRHCPEPKYGFSHIGIWMMSKWMLTDLTLSVEEGTIGSHCIDIEAPTHQIQGMS